MGYVKDGKYYASSKVGANTSGMVPVGKSKSNLATAVTSKHSVSAPSYKVNAPAIKNKQPLSMPLPPLLTRDGASAVASMYNGDGMGQPVARENPIAGVGYHTALGGYNPEAMDGIYGGAYDNQVYNGDGMRIRQDIPSVGPQAVAEATQGNAGATVAPPPLPRTDTGLFSNPSGWFNSMSTPNGMTQEEFSRLDPADQAKMMQGKSGWEKLGSTMSGVGSMAGGLAGVYGAYANAKYQKDQTNMQKQMIRGDEANKSAFAKAANGTYIGSGIK